MSQFKVYETLTQFRLPLIQRIISSLNIKPESHGADLGCGIGKISELLANEVGANGSITGLDYSEEFVEYCVANCINENTTFVQGNINQLPFERNSFDWIWSMDTVWAGPKEFGCPAESPDGILSQYFRDLKHGGEVYLLFWTSQKFLPGYPLLESKLNAAIPANAPYVKEMDPYSHNINAKEWLRKAGFSQVSAQTFIGDINAPLNDNDVESLVLFFDMLWSNAKEDLSIEEQETYKSITEPESKNFILNKPDYYGFYTYTLFKGKK
jgi:ubiquinone/menaquinone biosynthesis C-methylase UbiE